VEKQKGISDDFLNKIYERHTLPCREGDKETQNERHKQRKNDSQTKNERKGE
jgi:hypothetical protein